MVSMPIPVAAQFKV